MRGCCFVLVVGFAVVLFVRLCVFVAVGCFAVVLFAVF